jgi:hypothetical protein
MGRVIGVASQLTRELFKAWRERRWVKVREHCLRVLMLTEESRQLS